MSEQKQVSGVCSEVSERGEWTTFHVDIGTQYPVKLATKKAEIVELGRAASKSGDEFVWTYTESQGNENPHKPGTYYMNRYLEAVAPRDGSEAPQNATPAAQPPSRDERAQSEAVRQRLIIRQTCIKAAAEMLRLNDGTLEEQITAAITAAARFETWLCRDVDPVPFE